MKSLYASCVLAALSALLIAPALEAQNLPGSLSFTTAGSFANPTAESSNSVHLIDNRLTNGYKSGFDLKDVPSNLNPTGPTGSAAFQWGVAAGSSAYPHTSALIFSPVTITNAMPEKTFTIGTLFYRNGTITSNTGVSWVDLNLDLTFSDTLGLAPVSVAFGANLINTPNSSDAVASADIVSLHSPAAPLNFTDAAGNAYYLELAFLVDKDTMDGTLSTEREFRVFEGGAGTATLLGRFTTVPATSPIPEPSAAVLCIAGFALALRRKRD
jgi:hypothetical protein